MELCNFDSSLYRHLAEEARREARAEAIREMADEIDDCDAVDEMLPSERRVFGALLREVCGADTAQAEKARAELRKLIRSVKMRMARKEFERQCREAEEDAAIARYESRCEP